MPSQDSAKERFFKYFQKAAARDELQAGDFPQFNRADQMERNGEINGPFKKITLQGIYKSPPGSEDETGKCLRRALREAMRIDIENLPDVVNSNDLPSICKELGLTFHTGPGQVMLPKDRDIIILYKTRDHSAHAIVTNNLPEFSKRGKTIVGIIETPDQK